MTGTAKWLRDRGRISSWQSELVLLATPTLILAVPSIAPLGTSTVQRPLLSVPPIAPTRSNVRTMSPFKSPTSDVIGVSVAVEDVAGAVDAVPSAGDVDSCADSTWFGCATVCMSGAVAMDPQPAPETASATTTTSRVKFKVRTIASSSLRSGDPGFARALHGEGGAGGVPTGARATGDAARARARLTRAGCVMHPRARTSAHRGFGASTRNARRRPGALLRGFAQESRNLARTGPVRRGPPPRLFRIGTGGPRVHTPGLATRAARA